MGMKLLLSLDTIYLKKKNPLFFRAVLGLQQNWGKDTDTPHIPPHMHSLP